MTRVFVNGISAKSGGGRSILTNFLKVARNRDDRFEYIVAVPSLDGYEELANDRIRLIPMNWQSHTALIPLANTALLPRRVRQLGCNLVFNLSDIPMRTTAPQVLLFDWPYAIYTESPAWNMMSCKDKAVRSAKLFFFKLLARHVDLTVAQSQLVREQLEIQYGLSPVVVIGNSHYMENTKASPSRDFQLGDGFKALCISRYYTHKNFEIMLPLARLIKERRSDIKLIVTLEPKEADGARQFLNAVTEADLDDIIVNLGAVPMEDVSALFHQVDALFLPTLLETLGLTYFEAMHCDKPILTSDRPFAWASCGDAALYFDPFDENSILSSFEQLIRDPDLREVKIGIGREILKTMPNWEEAYSMYTRTFSTVLKAHR